MRDIILISKYYINIINIIHFFFLLREVTKSQIIILKIPNKIHVWYKLFILSQELNDDLIDSGSSSVLKTI